MKTRLLVPLLACVLGAGALAHAQKHSHRGLDCYRNKVATCFDGKRHALPASVAEFRKLRDAIGKTPWGGATLTVHALMTRLQNKALGNKFVVLTTAERQLSKTGRGPCFKGWCTSWFMRDYLRRADKKPHCMRAFAKGTHWKTGYKLDTKNVTVRFRRQDSNSGSIKAGRYRVFVCSTGADSCKGMWMRRNPKGFWKTEDIRSLLTGCRAPKKKNAASDDL